MNSFTGESRVDVVEMQMYSRERLRESRGRRSEGEKKKKRGNRIGYDDNNLSGSEDEPDVQVIFLFFFSFPFFSLVVLGGDVRVTDRRWLGRSTGNRTLGDREASTECTK